MHKSTKKLAFAGAAMALALVPAMAGAQEQTASPEAQAEPAPATAPDEASASRAPRPTTAAEKEAAIKSWPAETQSYYQSLAPARQEMFWALTDPDKVRLSKMPEEQRSAVWTSIEKQFAAAAPKKG